MCSSQCKESSGAQRKQTRSSTIGSGAWKRSLWLRTSQVQTRAGRGLRHSPFSFWGSAVTATAFIPDLRVLEKQLALSPVPAPLRVSWHSTPNTPSAQRGAALTSEHPCPRDLGFLFTGKSGGETLEVPQAGWSWEHLGQWQVSLPWL